MLIHFWMNVFHINPNFLTIITGITENRNVLNQLYQCLQNKNKEEGYVKLETALG